MNGGLQRESFLKDLRQATSGLHAQVESQVDIASCLVSLDAYKQKLCRFLGVYQVLEEQILLVPDLERWLPDISQRQRAPALRRDLRILGVNPANVECCSNLPPLGSLEQAFGCLYVLEGSTLGGQIIGRQVESALGLTSNHGCGFFCAADRNVPEKWARFRECIERFANSDPTHPPAIVAAAVRTFELFIAWFGQCETLSVQNA